MLIKPLYTFVKGYRVQSYFWKKLSHDWNVIRLLAHKEVSSVLLYDMFANLYIAAHSTKTYTIRGAPYASEPDKIRSSLNSKKMKGGPDNSKAKV